MGRESVLVVDDNRIFLRQFARELKRAGYEVETATDGKSALEILESNSFGVVVTDLRMDGIDGIELVRRIKARYDDCECIPITAFGNSSRSLEAMQAGALWYLEKPDQEDTLETLVSCVATAFDFRRLRAENRDLRDENLKLQRQLRARFGLENIIGHSTALRKVLDTVETVARTDANVLILGESGVGKELVARALHYTGHRADAPFVAVNCSALPSDLLESELFGHVRGAFTGATAARIGRFQAADHGTLFLDEIGDMSPSLQAKLLRVLQEQEFEAVGSSKTERVDVRIVAATNQDLKQLIAERRFREDLYYRLHVVPIEVPPLRSRRDDIPELAQHFLSRQRLSFRELEGISVDALKRMSEYAWPGNIRELEALVERLAVLKQSGWIREVDLPPELREQKTRDALDSAELPAEGIDLPGYINAVETQLICQALERTGGNKNRAAEFLGLKRTTLVEKIRSKGI